MDNGSNLCFLSPLEGHGVHAVSKILQPLQEVYPAVSSQGDLDEILAQSLAAVLQTTSAEGGELHLLDQQNDRLTLSQRQSVDGAAAPLSEYAQCDRFLELIARSGLPVLAWEKRSHARPAVPFGFYFGVPLVGDGRTLGALSIVSKRQDFDVALATRVLFPLAAQLGLYLRGAYPEGQDAHHGTQKNPAVEAARLRIHCMGPFQVYLDGEIVRGSQFQRIKALVLLKFLAANRGRPVPRDALIELLWPEAEPQRAGANLRVVLHALRRGLEPDLERGEKSSFVISQGDQVYLDPSTRVWVDAEEFVQRSRSAARLESRGRLAEAMSEYRRASSLYAGEYLEDRPYSEWVLFERQRLKEVCLQVLKQMAGLMAKTGDLAGEIETYRSALRIDQGREEVHRRLMLVLWKEGRRTEALRQYEACRTVLRQELETVPTEETESLHQAILAGAPVDE